MLFRIVAGKVSGENDNLVEQGYFLQNSSSNIFQMQYNGGNSEGVDAMIDERFYTIQKPQKLQDIAVAIGCIIDSINNAEEIVIRGIAPLHEADSGDITFLSNAKYKKDLQSTKATACIVLEDLSAESVPEGLVLLRSKNPYFSYSKLVDLFYCKNKSYAPCIKPSAYISPTAKIGEGCYIGHNVVIEDDVVIGKDSVIEAGTFIDKGVIIGDRAMIYSGVSISCAMIGDDVVILSGARIGQDGFGFATEAGVHRKVLHIGRVVIGNNVEIGANTTIDRGSVNDTIIGDLCRIDNLVQIGHNVKLGKGTVLVAQVGIAGSTQIGQYCALGGQVGISGHLKIGNKVQIAGQGGVTQDVGDGAILAGTPTMPIRDWHRQTIIIRNLIKGKK